MKTRTFAAGVAAACVLIAGALLWPSPERLRSPSVILITIDTLRSDHLSTYGYPRATSPNLEQLAREGALFEVAYSETNSTNPSHVSILTGTHVGTHRVIDTPQRFEAKSVLTLADRFHAIGYATAAIVSARHLNREPSGLGQGFDEYFDVEDTERRAGASLALAQKWLAAHAGRRFFLWLHLFDPHAPYDPPAPHDRQFVRTSSARVDVLLGRETAAAFFATHPLTEVGRTKLADLFALPFPQAVELNRALFSAGEVDYLRALYDGEIAYTDAGLGELFTSLRSLGISDQTLMVVTGDHGEAFGEHGIYCGHRTIYEETVRVPLIFHYPRRIAAGRRIGVMASHVDIVPTVLEYVGQPVPPELEGQSLVRAIEGATDFVPQPVFVLHTKLYASMVRSGRWKLIESNREAKAWWIAAGKSADLVMALHPLPLELYDLDDDPGEATNLSELQPAVVQRLRQLHGGRSKPPFAAPVGGDVDVETKERLRALGYID